MEDPCEKCIVQPCCSQLCWEKENYLTLLKIKSINFQEYVRRCTPRNNIIREQANKISFDFLKCHIDILEIKKKIPRE